MLDIQATILTADRRECNQEPWHRFFKLSDAFCEATDTGVTELNDATLKETHQLDFTVTSSMRILLLPVVGGLSYHSQQDGNGFLEVGEVLTFSLPAKGQYRISNPYKHHPINFLEIRLPSHGTARPFKCTFDLNTNKNQLFSFPLFYGVHRGDLHIGKFNGRASGSYKICYPESPLIVFVIEGAFEIEQRLLQSRDTLVLRNAQQINFEALSTEAVILILDVPKLQ